MENKYSFPIVDAKLKTYSNLLQGIEKKNSKNMEFCSITYQI
jgi:hypothetical protein